ncbi:SAM-dependent DNA methyltransferase [archaeon]|nr:SAM-dependent DNA methyltransferase [archaeon]MBT4397121.1 SAM-dependent DNA methyltransferase [archaeon]MBT4441573.1 SAM-dependent DNA methyltransferase [archaeon]
MALSTIIKSIQDIMRKDPGVDGDAQRISQITWMIFLKVFDDKEKEWELENNYKSPIPEKFRWRNWAADKEGITGEELLGFIGKMFKKFEELSVDNDPKSFLVKELFSDNYNYMKTGTLIRQVVNKLNDIDFNKTEDRHLFNDIYEQILKDLQSAGNAGEYYTPRAVTQFIVDMVNPQLGKKILDPACGTGGFLICTLENLKKQIKSVDERKQLQENIIGIEKKPLPHLLCTTNLILHDIEIPSIRHDNSLSRPIVDYGPSDKVDIVVTNPPFGGAEETGIELNFPSAYRTRETADLFLVLIMKLLKSDGKCGLVLPDGFLFGEGVKTRIKEKLLEEFNLHTIVRLPKGVFNPYTNIRTNLLFFNKGEKTKEVWYFEHPLPEGYKTYGKTKPIRIEEFDLEKKWWENRNKKEFKPHCWKVTIDEIKKRNYNLDINNTNNIDETEHMTKDELMEKISSNLDRTKKLLGKIKEEF